MDAIPMPRSMILRNSSWITPASHGVYTHTHASMQVRNTEHGPGFGINKQNQAGSKYAQATEVKKVKEVAIILCVVGKK
jgi:hypothetical protein